VPDPGFPLGRAARLAVLASGQGSNLQALLDAFPPDGGDPDAAVVVVVSDRADAFALERARRVGVAAHHLAYRRGADGALDRAAFEDATDAVLREHAVDLVALAGFMRILSPAFVARWSGRLLNVHPSLLPAHPGLHAVRQALAQGVRQTGCTVHFVDAGVDTGPVVLQRSVAITPGDDEASLQERVQREEHRAYPDAVRRVVRGEARP
jgi:phosphoribosylglycinamide formyltransferase-1